MCYGPRFVLMLPKPLLRSGGVLGWRREGWEQGRDPQRRRDIVPQPPLFSQLPVMGLMPSHVSWSLKDSRKPSRKLRGLILQKQISPLGLWHLLPSLSLVCFGILQPLAHLLSMFRLCVLQVSSVTLFCLKLECENPPEPSPCLLPSDSACFCPKSALTGVVSGPGWGLCRELWLDLGPLCGVEGHTQSGRGAQTQTCI